MLWARARAAALPSSRQMSSMPWDNYLLHLVVLRRISKTRRHQQLHNQCPRLPRSTGIASKQYIFCKRKQFLTEEGDRKSPQANTAQKKQKKKKEKQGHEEEADWEGVGNNDSFWSPLWRTLFATLAVITSPPPGSGSAALLVLAQQPALDSAAEPAPSSSAARHHYLPQPPPPHPGRKAEAWEGCWIAKQTGKEVKHLVFLN